MLNPITAIVLALTVSHTAAAAGAPSNAVADMIEKVSLSPGSCDARLLRKAGRALVTRG